MTCCSADIGVLAAGAATVSREELLLASSPADDGTRVVELSVPTVHCGACIHAIENALGRLKGVTEVRVNLTTRRVRVRWRDDGTLPAFAQTMAALGYTPHLNEDAAGVDRGLRELILALAVAAFSAGNIMALSVSVWSGADGPTQSAFHWLSALFGLPALIYSGRIFYRSAWEALRHGQTNMDVPISIGVLLAFGMSIYDTLHHAAYAYFDASVSLLCFLLVGRTLDHLMRERARNAVSGLARLTARGAMVDRDGSGAPTYLPVAEIKPGMIVLLAAGERSPVDAVILSGTSDLDCSLVTGESAPRTVQCGDRIEAGTLNLSNPLRLRAVTSAENSFLAEMMRLMGAAEIGRARYRRIADRAAALYAPAVHIIAFLSFIGWLSFGAGLHQAVTIAVAVLIITCPCALGLAVPIVQVIAARLLFERGIMVKDGTGFERLVEIDTVVFDKTGTLTLGRPELRDTGAIAPENLALARSLAVYSRHPYCRTLAAITIPGVPAPCLIDTVAEIPGKGVEALQGNDVVRLGRPDWVLDTCGKGAGLEHHAEKWAPVFDKKDATTRNDSIEPDSETRFDAVAANADVALGRNGFLLAAFQFDDRIRRDALTSIAELQHAGLSVELLSGDQVEAVSQFARMVGIEQNTGRVTPQGKTARLADLKAQGHKVLMVGDGLNDAPALASAHVSIAPSSAADVGRNAADFVFFRESLAAVPFALLVSRHVSALIQQNFALAIGYNLIALPFAITGYVTPLVAALAMSSSSILVVANAMRLGRLVSSRTPTPQPSYWPHGKTEVKIAE